MADELLPAPSTINQTYTIHHLLSYPHNPERLDASSTTSDEEILTVHCNVENPSFKDLFNALKESYPRNNQILLYDAVRFRVGDIYIDDIPEDFSHDVNDYIEMQPFFLEILTREQYEMKEKKSRGASASRYSTSALPDNSTIQANQICPIVALEFYCEKCGHHSFKKYRAGFRIDLCTFRKCTAGTRTECTGRMSPSGCILQKCLWKWRGRKIKSQYESSNYYVAENSLVIFTKPDMENLFNIKDWTSLKLITKKMDTHGHSLPLNDNDICLICLSDFKCGPDFPVTTCACKFKCHFECLKKWADTDSRCPTCREEFPDEL